MIKPPPEGPSDSPPDAPESDDAPQPERSLSESNSGELGDAIGRRLKTLYEGVAAEPVPDKLRQLVEELERKAGETK